MNKDLLELWGRMLLEMSKVAKGPQGFFDLFQNGFVKKEEKSDAIYEQFVELNRKIFGKDGIETFNGIMKEFYESAGVVPRAQYNELYEKYAALKEKVLDLEARIEKLKKKLEGKAGESSDLMEEWTETVRKYSEINQRFFEEFSKFFKP